MWESGIRAGSIDAHWNDGFKHILYFSRWESGIRAGSIDACSGIPDDNQVPGWESGIRAGSIDAYSIILLFFQSISRWESGIRAGSIDAS